MIKLNLEVDGEMVEYDIPSNWDDITVDQYAKVNNVDRELSSDIEASVEIIAALTGIDEDTLFMMSPEDFGLITKEVQFLNEEIEPSEVKSIVLNDEEWFVKDDFETLTMGEIVSIELLVEQSNSNLIAKFPELLCIFLRKKKENGKLEGFRKSFMERAELFKQVRISDINNLFVFFSAGENSSINNMRASLENQKLNK